MISFPTPLRLLSLVLALATPAAAELRLVREWKAAPVFLQHVEFSPDSSLLVTASGGGVAQLWTLAGQRGSELKGQRAPMFKAHFRSDGKELITTGYDGSAWIWSLNGERLRHLSFHRAATAEARFLSANAISPAGFVSSSDDGQVVIRDPDGQPIWSRLFTGTARQFVINQDANLIIASTDDGQLHLIRPSANRRSASVRTLQTDHGRINRIAFSPDQTQFAVAGVDGSVTIWKLNGQSLQRLPASSSGWSRGAVYCPTRSGGLLTIGDDGMLKQWSPSGLLIDSLRLSPHASLTSVDCSSNGQLASVVSSKGDLWLVSVRSGQP